MVSRSQDIDSARHAADSHEEPIIANCHGGEVLLVGEPVLGDDGEVIEEVADFLLLQHVVHKHLLAGGGDEQVLSINSHIGDLPVVLVDEESGECLPMNVHNPEL